MSARALSRDAHVAILAYGLTISEYVRRHFPNGQWQGDRCGCPDDRCTGNHHDKGDECGCLMALLHDGEPAQVEQTTDHMRTER